MTVFQSFFQICQFKSGYFSFFFAFFLCHLPYFLLNITKTIQKQRLKHTAFSGQDHLHRFLMRICFFIDSRARQCIVDIYNRNHLS